MADVAEHLVRFRRITEAEYGPQWEDAGDVQVAANDFRVKGDPVSKIGYMSSDNLKPGDGTWSLC
ncbi:hypothetical protein ABZT06_47125 [Streptomyces sp. NPDC005483]|uniref:hypothetical protein n=1 Tax=Streptomyces sp. NPDC005483 TaxID=3154882 RepID=UPI0033A70E35